MIILSLAVGKYGWLRTSLPAAIADRARGNVHVDAIVVGQGVAVTVAAEVVAVDVLAAVAVQKRRGVAVEPEEVGLGAGTSQRKVDHALTARLGVADQAAARNLRETDPRVVKSARGVARIVAIEQRRVHQGVLKSQKGAVLEAGMIVRKVALQVKEKLPKVVLQVARSHTEVDQEVPRVQRKAALLVVANPNSLVRTAERVAVVRQVETKRQTEKMTMGQSLPHRRGAVAVLVVRLNEGLLIKVARLVVKLIASLLLVTWMIVLQNIMRIVKWQEVVAGHQGMTKTKTDPLHVNRKMFRQVNVRVAVGRPVRRRRIVVDPSLEAQRKLKVEAVPAVMARIDVEVVQEVAARPGALHQVHTETESEVVASRLNAISQKVVLRVLQRLRIVVARPAVRKTRDGAILPQVVSRTTVELSRRAQKGRNREAVHGKNQRAATRLVKATHAVRLVHTADHHHVRRPVGKATRNHVANLPIKTKVCTTLPRI